METREVVFMEDKFIKEGLTFDDVLLIPQEGVFIFIIFSGAIF